MTKRELVEWLEQVPDDTPVLVEYDGDIKDLAVGEAVLYSAGVEVTQAYRDKNYHWWVYRNNPKDPESVRDVVMIWSR